MRISDWSSDVCSSDLRGMGAVYLNINRSKRGIVLDLKQAAGREALLRLVTDADVFVHSMRPETMARLGLTYEDCRAVNPRLVYCGCFGFHQDGPYADKAAYDDVIQGMSGLAAIQAMTTGETRDLSTGRSEAGRAGKACVSAGGSRGTPAN